MHSSSLSHPLRIGTRGSPLALAQAYEARDRLLEAHPGLSVEIVEIKTTGDKVQDRPLAEIGGKGLFSKELDAAQLENRVDIGVHSMKDLETHMPDGIVLAAFLPREDVRDALICPTVSRLADLPEGAVVGTSSLRRQAQILAMRPDLKVVPFRGNVQTRLRKLAAGEADATLLAMAGLNRLSMEDIAATALEPEELLPAVAQGAIGITTRAGADEILDLLAPLNDPETAWRVTAERAFLAELDGSCRTPIGGLAEAKGDQVRFRGVVARPDGSGMMAVERNGPVAEAVAIAAEAGKFLAKDMDDSYRP
ncbi:hydroxymethylbilane synthase [Hwanghaeella grinnelliae]|uniref:Porphobilinogen deaminase n=1 Tax=Hwanghaeella grinnelliae TaxID=2500179 RepID=A0A437QPE4_9PROT|nr:hydroxymethylbilane synthase [Hwanghaeella grinnelliae]RVU36411.1 hydroxymethylbilane synthase [Hwanghaeella grinnelliae]